MATVGLEGGEKTLRILPICELVDEAVPDLVPRFSVLATDLAGLGIVRVIAPRRISALLEKRRSHFLRQPAKVGSPIQRTTHHEDAETVFG